MEQVKQKAYNEWVFGQKTKTQIAREYGVSRRTLGRWFEDLTCSDDEDTKCKTHVSSDFKRLPKKALDPKKPRLTAKQVDANLEVFLEFIEQLAPVQFDKNIISTPSSQKSDNNIDVSVCAGDFHFGHECDDCIEIFYAVIEELQPDQIILNGDTLDMFALSQYPKDIRSQYNLHQEREAYHKMLYTLRGIAPNTPIIETNANHSGDSVEGRWWRYLSSRLGELASLEEVQEMLSYENLFLPKNLDIELVDSVELGKDFHIIHGDVVRGKAGATAIGLIDKWNASVMCNHTHRMGSTSRRVPSIGSRKEERHIAYENGCMCDLSPIYATAPDWQNGFSIIHSDDVDVAVEQIHIRGNKALSTTLGKEIIV